jgi:hypothetical protein
MSRPGEGAQLLGDRPDVAAECLRVAMRLKQIDGGAGGAERSGVTKVIGLLPASPTIGLHRIGPPLAWALASVTGETVAFVGANLRWSADGHGAIASMPPAASLNEEAAFPGAGYTARWIDHGVELISPPSTGHEGSGLPQLARLIRESSERYGRFLVDLTAYRPFGEHLAALEMMDGVVVVARAGVTREGELHALEPEVAACRFLGVLLIGGTAR